MENANGTNFSEVLHQYFHNYNNFLHGPPNMNHNFIIHHPRPDQHPVGLRGPEHQEPIVLNEEDEDDEDDLEEEYSNWALPGAHRRRYANRSFELAPGGDDASYPLATPDDDDRSERVPSGGEGDFAIYYGLPLHRERSNAYMHLRGFRQIIDRLNQRARRDRRERRDREELGYERPAIERELDEASDDDLVVVDDPLDHQPMIPVVPVLNLSQVHFVPDAFVPPRDPAEGGSEERRDAATQECPQPRADQSQQTQSQSGAASSPSSQSVVPSMGSFCVAAPPWPPLYACPPPPHWSPRGQPWPLSPNLQIRPRSRPQSSPSSSLSNESDTSSSEAYGAVLDRIGRLVRGGVLPNAAAGRHRGGAFLRPASRSSQGSRPSFRSVGHRRRADALRPRKKRNLFTATTSAP